MTYRHANFIRTQRALITPVALAALASGVLASNETVDRQRPTPATGPFAEQAAQLLNASEVSSAESFSHTENTVPAFDVFSARDARSPFFSFSALQDSPNLRLNGTDEVGRPYTIPATAADLGAFEELVFPMARRLNEPEQREEPRISYSALQSGDLNIYALVGGTDEQADEDTPQEVEAALNYRGEEVHPAVVPYFNDFESGERGMEWGSQSSVTTLESYSSFVGPLRRAEQVVHVRTEPNQAYALELDLYLIGFSESVPNERTGMFTVLVDGAPVIEQTFGSFRDLNGDDDEKNSDESINSPRNGHIIRGVQTRFTASSDVAEIVIKGNTGPGFGTGSWGFDNVLIDEAPETNLGSFSTADFTGDAEFTAFNQTPQRLNTQALQRNPGVDRLPDPRPFKATRGRSNPFFDLQAFLEELLEDLEDEEMMDEEEMMEDMMDDEEDEGEDQEDMPDENVPAPGPASLLMLGAAAGLRRRR